MDQVVEQQELLVVAPFGRDRDVLARVLSSLPCIITTCGPETGDTAAAVAHADALLITAEGARHDVVKAFADRLRGEPTWSRPPVVIVGEGRRDAERTASTLQGARPGLPVSILLRPCTKIEIYTAVSAALESRRVQKLVRDELERRRAAALYDALTGLPNRALLRDLFESALGRAKRSSSNLGLVALDVDRFKEINDNLGHQAGDELLKALTARIRAIVRSQDILARQSGDEFVLVLPEVNGVSEMEAIGQRIDSTVLEPLMLVGREASATVSMGLAVFPDDGGNFETLLRRADIALYRAKEGGRGRFCFYRPEMEAQARRQRRVEDELRQALASDQLTLAYQPQLDLADQRITSVEALVRWRHPERGLVTAADFLPVAEATGLIHPLGAWVVTEACRQIRAWRARGLRLRVGINVSAIEIRRDVLSTIDQAFAEHGVSGEDIELEFAESHFLDAADVKAVSLLRNLQERGVSIAWDDFGTGHSALSQLCALPVSTLKIDRTLVADMESREGIVLIEALLAVAKTLGKRVVAEGVETRCQLDGLQARGCDAVQGFRISRPLIPDDLYELLRGNANR